MTAKESIDMADGTFQISARVSLDPKLVLTALYEHDVLPNTIDCWVRDEVVSASFECQGNRVVLVLTGTVE